MEKLINSDGSVFIRKAEISDCRAVAELAVKMWNSDISELETDFTEIVIKSNGVVFIAVSDKKIIGFAQCGLRHDYVEGTESSPVGYLEGIFVEKQYRKKGYATMMLAHCEKWAKSKGCYEFASDCELDNTDSFAFHLNVGFQEANRIICFTKKL